MTAAQLLADEAYLFGDFPTENLTIAGTPYAVLVPRAMEGNEWGMGGQYDLPRLTLLMNRNIAPDVPADFAVGNAVTFRGETWRVTSIRRDFPQAPLSIELESEQGRPV